MRKNLLALCLLTTLTQLCFGGTPPPPPPCVEGGPHYGDWEMDSCPEQTTSPSVSPTTLCGEVGGAPCMPATLVAPVYDSGVKERPITYDCPCPDGQTCPSADYGSITYTVSKINWDPALPSKWAEAETFQSTAYVIVTSSDPDLCSSPGRVDIGPVSWNVVDPDPESPSTEIDLKSIVDTYYQGPAAAIAAVLEVVPSGCSFKKPEPSGKVTYTIPQKCCDCQNDVVHSTKKVKGSIGLEIPEFSCAIPGLGYKYKDWFYIGISGFCSGSVTVSVTYEKNPCDDKQAKICLNGSAEGKLGFRAGGAINITACTVDIHGDVSSSGNVSITACTGSPGDGTFVIQPLTLSGSCTVKTLFLTCEKKFPSIDLSPKIEIPIHINPISI